MSKRPNGGARPREKQSGYEKLPALSLSDRQRIDFSHELWSTRAILLMVAAQGEHREPLLACARAAQRLAGLLVPESGQRGPNDDDDR